MLEVALLVSLFAGKVADLPPGAVLRLGDARWRAGKQIHRLWFSTYGKTISALTVGSDRKQRTITWSTASGQRIAPAGDPPEGDARSVHLAGGGVLTIRSERAEVCDATGRRTATLGGHGAVVTAVAASADGTQLATGDAWGLVRIWDAGTLRPLNHPTGHTAAVTHAELSPDGKRLLTLAPDDTLRVWDMTTGKELRAFAGTPWTTERENGDPQKPAFTPDGSAVVFGTKDRLVARDVLTGLEVSLADGTARRPAAAGAPNRSPDGRQFADVDPVAPTRIRVCEVATGGVRRTFTTAGEVLGFTHDGTKLLTAGSDHTVLVWDVRPQMMPLPEVVRRETNAAKLWATMCAGKADAAYLAMARLAAEPDAAVGTARMRMKPADVKTPDYPEQRLADSRAIELLESCGTPEAWEFLQELAAGEATAFRTREARRALERLGR